MSSESSSPGKSSSCEKVVIFDIGDITLLSKTKIGTDYYGMNSSAQILSQEINNMLGERHLDDFDIQDRVFINIEDVVDDGTRESKMLAARFASLRRFYEVSDEREKENLPYTGSISFTQRWRNVRKCLEIFNKKNQGPDNEKYVIVVVGEDRLAHMIMQLITSSLASQISIENIYSADEISQKGTISILRYIKQQFDENCKFSIVTSSEETLEIAKYLDIAQIKVEVNEKFQNYDEKLREAFFQNVQQKQLSQSSHEEHQQLDNAQENISLEVMEEGDQQQQQQQQQHNIQVPQRPEISIKSEPIDEEGEEQKQYNNQAPQLREIVIKVEPMEEGESFGVGNQVNGHCAASKPVKRECPDAELNHGPRRKKPKRNISYERNEILDRAYPIPEKGDGSFFLPLKVIRARRERIRRAQEQKELRMARNRELAKRLGRGATTRSKAHDDTDADSENQSQEVVQPSASLESIREGMKKVSRKRVVVMRNTNILTLRRSRRLANIKTKNQGKVSVQSTSAEPQAELMQEVMEEEPVATAQEAESVLESVPAQEEDQCQGQSSAQIQEEEMHQQSIAMESRVQEEKQEAQQIIEAKRKEQKDRQIEQENVKEQMEKTRKLLKRLNRLYEEGLILKKLEDHYDAKLLETGRHETIAKLHQKRTGVVENRKAVREERNRMQEQLLMLGKRHASLME